MMRSTAELRGHDVALRDTAVLNGLTLFDSIVGSCRAFLPSNQFVQSGANRLIVFSLRFVKKPQHGKNGARKYDVKIYSSLLHPRDQRCSRGLWSRSELRHFPRQNLYFYFLSSTSTIRAISSTNLSIAEVGRREFVDVCVRPNVSSEAKGHSRRWMLRRIAVLSWSLSRNRTHLRFHRRKAGLDASFVTSANQRDMNFIAPPQKWRIARFFIGILGGFRGHLVGAI